MTDKIIAIDTHTHINHGHKLFPFASGFTTIVQIQPETDADYILPFANKHPDVTFIMAHMGSYKE